jgi:cell division protein FtsI/penicillin-binding protein 2
LIVVISLSLFSRSGKSSSSAHDVEEARASEWSIKKDSLSAQIGSKIRANEYPEVMEIQLDGSNRKTKIQYGIEESAQKEMRKIIGQYKPDYGAFVAMDARTGRIISMVSFSRNHPGAENLVLKSTFPAASIFKVVTAGAALDLSKAAPGTVVPFNGANHTLYKRNVEDFRETRWTRYMTMREAFARSVNVFFGKLGLFYVGPNNLMMYAERFMFNHPIQADIPVDASHAKFSAEDPWSVASAASGFTRDNTMSPMHGALIAAAVANDGIMMEPYLVNELANEVDGEVFYRAEPRRASVVFEPKTAEGLRELFKQTVLSGTSRKSFRKTVRRSAFDDVEFGGKTGSLTGTQPAGKCDWFVGYARYQDQRIAVAALTVNEKNWRVKSSTLANYFFTHYLKELKQRDVASRP